MGDYDPLTAQSLLTTPAAGPSHFEATPPPTFKNDATCLSSVLAVKQYQQFFCGKPFCNSAITSARLHS